VQFRRGCRGDRQARLQPVAGAQALASFGLDGGTQVALGDSSVRQAIAPYLIAAPSS
jgi:hypothetical protein